MKDTMIDDHRLLKSLTDITSAEMGKPCSNGLPPCIKVGHNKYRFGLYNVRNANEEWVVEIPDHPPLSFSSLQSAVIYCVYYYAGNINEATIVKNLDDKVVQLDTDKQVFDQLLKTAIKKKDGWKIDLYTAKYLNADAHFTVAKKELKNTLYIHMKSKFKKLTLNIK